MIETLYPQRNKSCSPQAERDEPILLHSGFLSNANHHPNAIALTIAEREWTYAEMEATARQWASAILEGLGHQPARVGVFAYRSEVSYVGVLASLLAGAAFVPLNRTFPLQRTRLMIEQAELDAILVDKGSLPQFLEIIKDLKRVPSCVLLPDSESDDDLVAVTKVLDNTYLKNVPVRNSLPMVSADSTAYLLFTSGSTGIPKGVPISHSNVVHFIQVNQERYQFKPTDRFTQTFDQTFDLSVFDLFMAWNAGATVCSIQPIELLAPARFIREKQITVWFSVPSVATLLRKQGILHPNSFPSLRWSLFCGEALPKEIAELWQEAAPHSIVENLYGPTELTIACSVYRWNPSISPGECVNGIVPIGRPYPGLEAILLDEHLKADVQCTEGELCIAGPQTFSGYWRAPEQTLQKMIRIGEKLFYRTGDRVRRLPNGNLVYLGRMDQQIKVMGYRVELSEIEGVLNKQPGVVSSAAVGWPLEDEGAKGIEAFVVLEKGADVTSTSILANVRSELPNYMIPRTIHFLEEMPLNVNGKIDRKELLKRLESFRRLEGNP